MALNKSYDVIVVGGGAIGTATARRLSQSGRSVLLLERGQIGNEASGAAGGMLGAQLEVGKPGPFFHLCVESRSYYPQFARDLLEETGVDIQLFHNGILNLAYAADEVRDLKSQLAWQTNLGATAEWWNPDAVVAAEPSLAKPQGALLYPHDGNVMAPSLMKALAVAVGRTVDVQEGTEVRAIRPSPTGVQVDTTFESYWADHVVIATGAWAKPFLAQVGFDFHVYPVQGQMVAIRPRRGTKLQHTVFSQHAYLVPKRDGTIVVGATEDHNAGFQLDVTVHGLAYLANAIERIAPDFADAAFERAWIGLRPGSQTSLPVIGPLPHQERVIVAAGHFRNGILLAPITAEMVTRALDRRPWPELWRAFLPENTATGGKEAGR